MGPSLALRPIRVKARFHRSPTSATEAGQSPVLGVSGYSMFTDTTERITLQGVGKRYETASGAVLAVEAVSFGLELQGVGAARRREIALGLLEPMGLRGFEGRYPRELSGGMRQRVAIARALALGTPVLLMDEPFGALDEQTRLLMGEWLVGIRRLPPKTVVFVTHSLQEAIALSDRIVVMTARPGRVKDVVDVMLPYPRDLNSAAVADLRAKLWDQVREESLKAMGGRL